MPPGEDCTASRVHMSRVVNGIAVAAGQDKMLDPWYPPHGPCEICGMTGQDARHRAAEAVLGRLRAGEDEQAVAAGYGLEPDAIQATLEWGEKWWPMKKKAQ